MISTFVVTPDHGLVHVRKTKSGKGIIRNCRKGRGVVINNFTFRSGNGEVLSKKCESLKPHSGTKTSILRAIEAGIY